MAVNAWLIYITPLPTAAAVGNFRQIRLVCFRNVFIWLLCRHLAHIQTNFVHLTLEMPQLVNCTVYIYFYFYFLMCNTCFNLNISLIYTISALILHLTCIPFIILQFLSCRSKQLESTTPWHRMPWRDTLLISPLMTSHRNKSSLLCVIHWGQIVKQTGA